MPFPEWQLDQLRRAQMEAMERLGGLETVLSHPQYGPLFLHHQRRELSPRSIRDLMNSPTVRQLIDQAGESTEQRNARRADILTGLLPAEQLAKALQDDIFLASFMEKPGIPVRFDSVIRQAWYEREVNSDSTDPRCGVGMEFLNCAGQVHGEAAMAISCQNQHLGQQERRECAAGYCVSGVFQVTLRSALLI